jgi:hypothetical protein
MIRGYPDSIQVQRVFYPLVQQALVTYPFFTIPNFIGL